MEGMVGGIIIVGIVLFFIYSVTVGPERQIDGAMKRARERQEKEMRRAQERQYKEDLSLMNTPRFSRQYISQIDPDGVVVMLLTQAIGDQWHILLHEWNASADVDTLAEGTYFLLCSGDNSEPIGVHPFAPTEQDLYDTISCPDCYHVARRIFALNDQPYSRHELHPQHMQLLVTPDMVPWDIRRLHPPVAPAKPKGKAKRAAERTR